MQVILAIIIILILLLVVLLFIPFRLSLSLDKEGPSIHGFYKVACFGLALQKGAISPPRTEDIVNRLEREQEKWDAEEGLKEGKETDYLRIPAEVGPVMEILPAVSHIVVDLIRSISVERLCCKISFGLNDPVDTAVMSGYLWSAASAIGLYRADILIEPCFEDVRLEGAFLTELQARLLWFVVALIKALKEEKIRKLVLQEIVKGVRA